MMKENKKQLIVSSIIILLPILIGLLLWNRLPDTVATHWGADGTADGWGSKAFAVFAPPLILLATHWLCVLVTSADPINKKHNAKAKKMVLWTIPIVSLFSSAMLYGTVLDAKLNMASITFAVVGLLFLGLGNYLPKVRQNYTIGIKVPWALHNEENWNATHRFGGKVWVIGGLALLLLSFLPMNFTMVLMVIILLVMGFTPMIYSYLYYRKQVAGCTASVSEIPAEVQKQNSAILKGTLIFLVIIFAILGFLLFSGHIDVIYEADSFTLDPSQWNSLTVDYEDIEAIEYRDGNVEGTRTWGLGSFRLLLGSFENEEFGSYTRYTYYRPEACVILTVEGKTLVISGADAAETAEIYEELSSRMEG
ncbi:MAG: SdpI family protein [Oscillospiraceae bacterium]|nr:SdpI family protein [Oscillospiraceae bacterium]